MALGMLGNAKDPANVKLVLSRIVPEIDKAVSSVDGLIADVMEVGSNSTQLIQEPISPECLIESTLNEIFRVYPKSDVSIVYDLRHVHMVNVHVNKVARVFSNIVGNAIQAINFKGIIWFKTREMDGMMEFCLGNAGSIIPPENISRLFDAFFTSGKRGGTGLGLAIAEKVVKAHGGKIWCESSITRQYPEGKVEFFFTLPVTHGVARETNATLPSHSVVVIRNFQAMSQMAGQGTSVDQGELVLESEIVQSQRSLGRALRVLIVDDEAVYCQALTSYLSRTEELSGSLDIVQANSADNAIALATCGNFDLVISDVDMGTNSANGFELVEILRSGSNAKSLICVHSNRMVPADQKTAIDAGADAFIPKPIARGQLLKLVLQAIRKAPTALAIDPARDQARPVIAVAEDNPFILDAWIHTLTPDAQVIAADSPEKLLAKLDQQQDLIVRLSGVIVDQNFDNSTSNGMMLGRLLKGRRRDLTVLLSSDGIYEPSELAGAIDRAIVKEPIPFGQLGLN